MKLISIELKNFRQFYGVQKIEFAIEAEKNVTLIHGENNGGKTALLNAIRWCLYKNITENLLDSNTLLNKHAHANNDNVFWVKIRLIHDNKLYEVYRTKEKVRVFPIDEHGSFLEEQDDPQFLINSFLPFEMAKFFFYQGEGTGTLSSQNDFKEIDESIRKILGLTVAEQTIKHLKSIKNAYEKEKSLLDSTGELDSAYAAKISIEAELDTNETLLKKYQTDLHDISYEIGILQHKKYEYESDALKDKYDRRNKVDSDIKITKEFKKDIEEGKKTLLPKWLHDSYINRLIDFNLSSINMNSLNVTARYVVDKNLITQILKNSECICGCDIQQNPAAKKLIEELSKHAIDPNIHDRWKKTQVLFKQLKSAHGQVANNFIKYQKDIDTITDKLSNLYKEYDELSAQIRDFDVEEVIQNDNKLHEKKNEESSLIIEIDKKKNLIHTRKNEMKDIDLHISKLNLNVPEALKIQTQLDATNAILRLFENELKNSRQNVDEMILKNMQELFEKVAFNGYTIKKENDKWIIVDKENNRVAAGNGYQAMLAISFVVSLIKFSSIRKNDKRYLLTPGTTAPFIADSILAFIGPDNGRELVRFISESVEQCVFLFSQAQWTNTHTDKGIRQRIGKEYNLVQHSVLTEAEFRGSYPTNLQINANKYDVVRFGSDFDKVVIEEIF